MLFSTSRFSGASGVFSSSRFSGRFCQKLQPTNGVLFSSRLKTCLKKKCGVLFSKSSFSLAKNGNEACCLVKVAYLWQTMATKKGSVQNNVVPNKVSQINVVPSWWQAFGASFTSARLESARHTT